MEIIAHNNNSNNNDELKWNALFNDEKCLYFKDGHKQWDEYAFWNNE